MNQTDAIALINSAITGNSPQQWADLGSGSGTFTLALNSILPSGSSLVAIDKSRQELPVEFIRADFEKDALPLAGLDGIMMANSIHYVRDKQKLIRKLERYFSADPTFLFIEYDTTRYSPWVPYPVSFENLQALFRDLGYLTVTKLASKPSRFGGILYSALVTKS